MTHGNVDNRLLILSLVRPSFKTALMLISTEPIGVFGPLVCICSQRSI
jgi:hypothetical protein